MSIVDNLIPDNIKPIVARVFTDKELSRDLGTVLSAAGPLLEAAGKNPATNQSLREVFNDAASVVPYAKKCLEKGKILMFGAPISSALRLKSSYKTLVKATEDQDPAVINIISSLLKNNAAADALERSSAKLMSEGLADKEIRRDLDIVLSAAAPLFEAAGKNPAADKNLQEIFNDVASVIPFGRKTLEKGVVPVRDITDLLPNFLRLTKNGSVLETAVQNKDPVVNDILTSLLKNNDAQAALERIFAKPQGQGLFTLKKEAGQGYAVEQLSGANLSIPLPDANYDKIKAILDAAAPAKPQPPKGPSV